MRAKNAGNNMNLDEKLNDAVNRTKGFARGVDSHESAGGEWGGRLSIPSMHKKINRSWVGCLWCGEFNFKRIYCRNKPCMELFRRNGGRSMWEIKTDLQPDESGGRLGHTE